MLLISYDYLALYGHFCLCYDLYCMKCISKNVHIELNNHRKSATCHYRVRYFCLDQGEVAILTRIQRMSYNKSIIKEMLLCSLQLGVGCSWEVAVPVGALSTEGGCTRITISRKKGSFLRPPHIHNIVKEGYFFVPRYEVWG